MCDRMRRSGRGPRAFGATVALAVTMPALAGCILIPYDPPRGAGIYVVNESGVGLVFEHEGTRRPVLAEESVTLWFGSSDNRRECATDIRVVTEDGTAEAWRDEICEDETWTIRAEDLKPVEP